MATFRNACGECRYTTPWLTESEAERRIIDHYARHHPHLVPGGALLLGLFVLIVIISLAGQK